MKIKIRYFIIAIILVIAIAVFAQNITNQPSQEQNNGQNSQNNIITSYKPIHHAEMPRRITQLKFDRFQQDVDFEDKLKKSNKLLY